MKSTAAKHMLDLIANNHAVDEILGVIIFY